MTHAIESYRFGAITINGVEYDDDVIITPEGIRPHWWRKEGHEISLFDLAHILDHPPKRLIIGTGAYGACTVHDEVVQYCRLQKIELIVHPTPEAVVEYNELTEKQGTIAVLHLTC